MAATPAEKKRAVEQQVNANSLLKPSQSEKSVTLGSNGGETQKGKRGMAGAAKPSGSISCPPPHKHPTEGVLRARQI